MGFGKSHILLVLGSPPYPASRDPYSPPWPPLCPLVPTGCASWAPAFPHYSPPPHCPLHPDPLVSTMHSFSVRPWPSATWTHLTAHRPEGTPALPKGLLQIHTLEFRLPPPQRVPTLGAHPQPPAFPAFVLEEIQVHGAAACPRPFSAGPRLGGSAPPPDEDGERVRGEEGATRARDARGLTPRGHRPPGLGTLCWSRWKTSPEGRPPVPRESHSGHSLVWKKPQWLRPGTGHWSRGLRGGTGPTEWSHSQGALGGAQLCPDTWGAPTPRFLNL